MGSDLVLTVLKGVPTTLLLTGASLGIGIVGGLPFVAARVSNRRLLRFLSRSLIEVFRGIPPLVWLFIIYFGLGTSLPGIEPLQASIIGMGLISCAYMAEIYRGGLAAVHHGQWEAARALGMSGLAIVRKIIAPQVFRISVPATATYGIGLFKDSSVAFTLGVGEILFFANQQSRTTGDAIKPFLVAAVLYIVLSAACAALSRSLDRRLQRRVAR
ncbi:amino acid ABC transporter permease [Streptomyces sp. TRM70350]|uniref:amino acid ABC transporter permease n=1 Tax=Streptomyces sp. TRM70350 TaxID=2856165 RepID=UPI001C4796B2|nr:amino acid ABC transporter permease [Streptomyces sp. TRM70350]MBV7699829.1 amino acid ABC transporter permease [Streptomyces sp. TRM70350]